MRESGKKRWLWCCRNFSSRSWAGAARNACLLSGAQMYCAGTTAVAFSGTYTGSNMSGPLPCTLGPGGSSGKGEGSRHGCWVALECNGNAENILGWGSNGCEAQQG